MNLVVNARDAMPEGGALTIETANVDRRTRRGDGTIEPGAYVMLDRQRHGRRHGRGDARAQIFEPFFTTKERARAPGSGSRPSTASSSRAAATSRSRARSARLRRSGSTCAASTRARQPEAETAAAPPLRRRAGAAGDGARGRGRGGRAVLVVQVLEGEGYHVLVAQRRRGGPRARRAHRRRRAADRPDDAEARRAASWPSGSAAPNPELKVSTCPATPTSGIFSDGVLPPGTAFLSKPFTFAELAESVRGLL